MSSGVHHWGDSRAPEGKTKRSVEPLSLVVGLRRVYIRVSDLEPRPIGAQFMGSKTTSAV